MADNQLFFILKQVQEFMPGTFSEGIDKALKDATTDPEILLLYNKLEG